MAMDTRVRPTGHLLPYQPSYQVRPAPHSRFAVTLITVATALVGAVLFVGGLMLIAALFVMVSLVALLAAVVRGTAHAVTPRAEPQVERQVGQRDLYTPAVIDTTARVSPPTASTSRF